MKNMGKWLALVLALVLAVSALPVTAAAAAGFADVPAGAYYAEAVEWALEMDITNGTSPTTFSPADTVTREEAVTFLWRAAREGLIRSISFTAKAGCPRRDVVYCLWKQLGDGEAISQMPLHPYTEALFSASMEVEGDRDRIILSGDLPSPAHPPAGCPFHTRCFACEERCKTEKPQLREFEGGRFCACHRVEERTGLKPVAAPEQKEEKTE